MFSMLQEPSGTDRNKRMEGEASEDMPLVSFGCPLKLGGKEVSI